MTDNDYDDGNGDTAGEAPQQEPGWLRDLRRKADKVAQLETKLQQYEQREAVRSAGLTDLSDRQMKALLATHEGEATPEAWKQTAAELGFYKPEPEVDPEVQKGHEGVASISQGAQTQPQISAEDEYAQASTPEEVMRIAERRGSPVQYAAD